jgi:hypothetical protein
MFSFNFVENEPQIDQKQIKGDLILFISFCSKISTIKIIFLKIHFFLRNFIFFEEKFQAH